MTTKAADLSQTWVTHTYTDQGVYDPLVVGYTHQLGPWTHLAGTVDKPGATAVVGGDPTLVTAGIFHISTFLRINRFLTEGESVTAYMSDGNNAYQAGLRWATLDRIVRKSSLQSVAIHDSDAVYEGVIVNAFAAPLTVHGRVRSIGLKAPVTVTVTLMLQEVLAAGGVVSSAAPGPVPVLASASRNKVVTFSP